MGDNFSLKNFIRLFPDVEVHSKQRSLTRRKGQLRVALTALRPHPGSHTGEDSLYTPSVTHGGLQLHPYQSPTSLQRVLHPPEQV